MEEWLVDVMRETFSLHVCKLETLGYGENPHQRGALYTLPGESKVLGGQVLGGKALSYNNILDLDAAWRTVGLFEEPTVVVVKHLTPCGVASAATAAQAVPLAVACDPGSAYGGVIAVNRTLDKAFVDSLGELFIEAMETPDFTEDAQKLLTEKRKNCRLLRIEGESKPLDFEYRSVRGGLLVQSLDVGDPSNAQW